MTPPAPDPVTPTQAGGRNRERRSRNSMPSRPRQAAASPPSMKSHPMTDPTAPLPRPAPRAGMETMAPDPRLPRRHAGLVPASAGGGFGKLMRDTRNTPMDAGEYVPFGRPAFPQSCRLATIAPPSAMTQHATGQRPAPHRRTLRTTPVGCDFSATLRTLIPSRSLRCRIALQHPSTHPGERRGPVGKAVVGHCNASPSWTPASAGVDGFGGSCRVSQTNPCRKECGNQSHRQSPCGIHVVANPSIITPGATQMTAPARHRGATPPRTAPSPGHAPRTTNRTGAPRTTPVGCDFRDF
jgi:hypothetical protein